MGGDFAPAEAVAGAVTAARDKDIEIVLIGKPDLVKAELAKHQTQGLKLEVIEASEVIEMSEHPANAVKNKKNSSIMVGMSMLRKGEVGALVRQGIPGP